VDQRPLVAPQPRVEAGQVTATSGGRKGTSRRGQLALVSVLCGGPVGAYWGPDALEELTQAADHHGIVIPLYRAYSRGDLRSGDATLLAALGHRRRAGALQLTVSAVEVCESLEESGVPYAIVKGPALALAYEDADRQFVDIDLLVAPGHMPRAIGAIERLGASVIGGVSWPRGDGIAEMTLMMLNGTNIDLHANLVVHADDRRAFHLHTESLLSRRTTACVLGHEVSVLGAEDTLVHVALHAALSGGDRLIWLADLDALVRQDAHSWSLLVDRSREAGAALVVGVMLDRAVEVLGCPVPLDVLRALERRGILWAKMLRQFERWRPTAANYNRNLRGQVLIRSTRHSTYSSLAALMEMIRTDVLGHVLHDRQHPWRVRIRQHWVHR
jgi:Uncharacterised nucleotidyltransferase